MSMEERTVVCFFQRFQGFFVFFGRDQSSKIYSDPRKLANYVMILMIFMFIGQKMVF